MRVGDCLIHRWWEISKPNKCFPSKQPLRLILWRNGASRQAQSFTNPGGYAVINGVSLHLDSLTSGQQTGSRHLRSNILGLHWLPGSTSPDPVIKRTKFYQEITHADCLRSQKNLNCSSPIKLVPAHCFFNAGPLGFITRFGRIDLTGQTECCCYSVNGSIQHPTSAACYHNTSFYTKRSNGAQRKCQG